MPIFSGTPVPTGQPHQQLQLSYLDVLRWKGNEALPKPQLVALLDASLNKVYRTGGAPRREIAPWLGKRGKRIVHLPGTDRYITLDEAWHKKRLLLKADSPETALEILHSPTRRERRHRKSAPAWKRVRGFLVSRLRENKGAWIHITYADLMQACEIGSQTTVSRALTKLEGDPRFRFRSDYPGDGKRGRRKLVCFSKWLKFDGEPLQYRRDGKCRRLRESFTEDAPLIPKDSFREPGSEENSAPSCSSSQKPSTNSTGCPPYPVRAPKVAQQTTTPSGAGSDLAPPAGAENFQEKLARPKGEKLRKRPSGETAFRRKNGRLKNLAFGLCRTWLRDFPALPRVDWNFPSIVTVVFGALEMGYLAKDIRACLREGLTTADSAASDTAAGFLSVKSPERYAVGLTRLFLKDRCKRYTPNQIANERRERPAYKSKPRPVERLQVEYPTHSPKEVPSIVLEEPSEPELPPLSDRIREFHKWHEQGRVYFAVVDQREYHSLVVKQMSELNLSFDDFRALEEDDFQGN